MTVLRDHLREQLASKLRRYGVVIWDDREQFYASIIGEIVPEGAALACFDGSWLALRRDIESRIAGDSPPHLLVYVPAQAPTPDPLGELRAVGTRYCTLLPAVIRASLRGQLTDGRLEELGKQCQTLEEVEAMLDAGASEADARLVALVNQSGTAPIARELLSGAYDDRLSDPVLFEVAQHFFLQASGVAARSSDGTSLREEVFRHFVLTVVEGATGSLPEEWAGSFTPPTPSQRKAVADTWAHLRGPDASSVAVAELAEKADSVLCTAAVLTFGEGLEHVDLTPGLEEVVLGEGKRSLTEGDWQAARDLARIRLKSSWWALQSGMEFKRFDSRWRAIDSIAELNAALRTKPPSPRSLESTVDWYWSAGWEADSAYRRMELQRVTTGADLVDLDDHFRRSRKRYEEWLDQVLRHTADAISEDAHVGDARQQRRVHHLEVQGGENTAYVLVDALRYELGRDLATRLGSLNAVVSDRAAVAAAPTITRVGMAAVTPGADERFDVELDPESRLEVQVQGRAVRSAPDRIKRFEKTHGKVADMLLDELVNDLNIEELKKQVKEAALVVVRSTEIDAVGENDQLAASWGTFDNTLDLLHTAVARLLLAGVKRVVLTADHGFLAVSQVGEDRRIDRPLTGKGELHRRAWIGIGGTATDSTVKVPLADFGIGGGLDIITPRGLGVFLAGGGLQFFHGGLSPQELVVPVITVVADEPAEEPEYQIDLSVAGGRITTGILAVTVQMSGDIDLWTQQSCVRVVLSQEGKRIARVVGGDGFDRSTDTINVAAYKAHVITMQILQNLAACSVAKLEVLDASTGIRKGDAVEVEVAANVIVEDEL